MANPRRLGLSGWILVGLGLGIGTGLFFGELTAFLQVPAKAFIRLLQMAVLPYVIVSLIAGLGSLSYGEAGAIARRCGLVLLLLWGITLAVVGTIPLAFPDVQSASFFSTTLVEPRPELDFVGLYIPANPFRSLSENAVPAVVLFCIALGVALIGVEGREGLIGGLQVISKALARMTAFVVRLTPFGVFAIAAHAAGIMTIEEFGRLQVFVVTYLAACLYLVFWALPALVAALTPLRYGEVLRASRDALVTAFSTGSTFVVLPMLAETAKGLLARLPHSNEAEATVDVVVPASFNFPTAGRLFALTFLLFAAWYQGDPVTLSEYPAVIATGLLSLFSNVAVALPFLLDLFRIPADMFQLFVAVGVVESRLAALLAGMHILALALLGTCAVSGTLQVEWSRIARYALISIALAALFWAASAVLVRPGVGTQYAKATLLTERALSRMPVEFAVIESPAEDWTPRKPETPRLEQIRERGSLRVGFAPEIDVPFAYRNDRGELVGLDVDMAHALARDLDVRLELVAFEQANLARHIASDHFDIAMSGLVITLERSEQLAATRPYLDLTFAFVTKDHRRHEFTDRAELNTAKGLRIAVPGGPYYREKFREYVPLAELVPMDSLDQVVAGELGRIDAIAYAAEPGAAWTLIHPSYTVVVPQPDPFQVPMVYYVQPGDQAFLNFVNDWLELKKRDATLEELYSYWILGQDDSTREPRWSVVRDVLHWID